MKPVTVSNWRGVGQRAHLGVGRLGIAELDRAGAADDPVDELVVDVAVREQARPGHAGLTARREDARDDPVGHRVEVGVVEDDLRGLAPELERDARQRPIAACATWIPTAVEPVNASLSTPGWAARARPVSGVDPVTTLNTPGGQPRLLEPVRELERRDRRVVGGLDDERASRRQRGRELPGQEHQRRVPGHDRANHADGLMARVDQVVAPVGVDRVAVDLVGEPGEVAVPVGQGRGLARHLAQELAVVQRLDLSELGRVALEHVGDAQEHAPPLAGAHLAPRARQRVASRPDRAIDILRAALRHGRPRLAGERVERVVGAARGRRRPGAADRQLVGPGVCGRRAHRPWAFSHVDSNHVHLIWIASRSSARLRRMPPVAELERMLRGASLRVTRPRVAVLAAVHDHPHADTYSIIGHVRDDLGGVSQQAVYDVLQALTDAGLVRRIQPPGSVARYESRVGDNHHHVVCRSCGVDRRRRLRRRRRPVPDRLRRPRLRDRRGRGRLLGPVPRMLPNH